MNEGPDRCFDLGSHLLPPRNHARQPRKLTASTRARAHDFREALRGAHIRTEHHAEDPGIAKRELDIGISRRFQRGKQPMRLEPIVHRAQPLRELLESLAHQCRQDRLSIGEVVVRRLMGASCTTSNLAHAQGARPALIEKLSTGPKKIGAQVATTALSRSIRLFDPHAGSLRTVTRQCLVSCYTST